MDKRMPGSYFDIGMREWFDLIIETYADTWGTTPTLLDAGMEDVRSPYMVLSIDGRTYLLLERRNDDGEWAPLLFDAPGMLPTNTAEVFTVMSRVGEYAQELTGELHDRCVIADHQDAEFEQCLATVLYGYRDLVSPAALD
jgi:hypothetical protein